MGHEADRNRERSDTVELARRAVLRATGGVAALSLGVGTTTAASGTDERLTDMQTADDIDPIFGKPSASPLGDDGVADHVVDLEIKVNGLVFAAAQAETPSLDSHIDRVNEAAADGQVTQVEANQLKKTIALPDGSSVPLSAVAEALIETLGFHFHPAGLWVEPGDVVAFNAVSPDHLVASYHERHGRQNRVPGDPDTGTGLIASPLVPIGGNWLYQFEDTGVYDLNCTVHELFGMVMRVVVVDGSEDVPELDVQNSGRPPAEANEIALAFGGLDPNLPSAAEALATDALDPQNIVDEDEVLWEDVVEEHRTG